MKLDSVSDWRDFLENWSSFVVKTLRRFDDADLDDCELEAVGVGTLLQSAASKEQVADIENRLETSLPTSYTNFLRASNGWNEIALDAKCGRFFCAKEVGYFRDIANRFLQMWLEAYSDIIDPDDYSYYRYGDAQDSAVFRPKYLQDCIAISEFTGQAIVLLNPHVQFENGEWESMVLGSQLPGANRYKSFTDLMLAQRRWTEAYLQDLLEDL